MSEETTTRMGMNELAEGDRGKETIITEALTAIDLVMWNDMGEYTVAQLPDATLNPDAYALATNASGGRTICRSNGTVWKVVVVEGATVTA